jgi:thymidylate kinase/thymidylate synthase ThyX/deoxycytidylate deaminase
VAKLTKKKIVYPYMHPKGKIGYVSVDNVYMEAAKEVARTESLDKTMPTGAVIVKDGQIIGRGANGSTYHDLHGCERVRLNIPTGQSYELCEGCNPKNHSEPKAVQAAQQAGHDTQGAEAYLWGHWWCCEPCWKAMTDAGISKVYLLEDSHNLFNKLAPDNIVGKQFAQIANEDYISKGSSETFEDQTVKPTPGVFVVIEGSDGSGKGTQFQLLADHLAKQGYDVATFDFPRYDKSSSHFVNSYLNGEYGTAEEVGPYAGSMFYALDRYEAAKEIRDALDQGKVVLANRYTGSNMAHQGAKFDNVEQRRGYFIWLDNLEFQVLNIPRPDISIILRVPAEIAQKLVDQKAPRSYTDKKRDIHEADLEHLRRSVEVYDDMAQLFPKDFITLDCVRGGKLMSVETIQKLLWETVHPLLPAKTGPRQTAKKKVGSPPEMANKRKITAKDRAQLAEAVTDVSGDVYAFTGTLSSTTIAAAMARLSRRGDDMRTILLEEFLGSDGQDAKLLQRVITAYGDDSVQQLTGQHVVVENASNLLTKKLERSRLAAYLEQSTRYIYFDQKDSDGNYKYYIPHYFDPATQKVYISILDDIFELYSDIVHELTSHVRSTSKVPKDEQDAAWQNATRAQACDAARAVLPVAVKSTVGIFASGQALENMILRLQSDALPEAQIAGRALLQQARKTIPAFLERADKPERGGAMVAYQMQTAENLAKLAQKYLPDTYSDNQTSVTLTNVWPRNELDIVPDILYEHSNRPLADIKQEVEEWSYERKLQIFEAYMGERLNRRQKPGRALEKIHYSWDLMCDYGIFRDLQRHRMVDDLEWQPLTPRYGYEIPALVEEANLSESFEKCFDLSLKLYSALQEAGYANEAQYATLLGHRMRWKVTYNAREAFHIHELRTSPQGHPGYRKLMTQMHEKLSEVHPLLGNAMKFVNVAEDPDLTRLAAERYTQFKLDQL